MGKIVTSGIGGILFFVSVLAFIYPLDGAGPDGVAGWTLLLGVIAVSIVIGVLIGKKRYESGCVWGCGSVVFVAVFFMIFAYMFDKILHSSSLVCVVIGLIVGIAPWIPGAIGNAMEEKKRERAEWERGLREAEQRRKDEQEERRKMEEANSKAAQEQRQKNAKDFKSELSVLIAQCGENVRTSETWGLNPAYEAVAVQKDVWNAVDEAFVPLQRFDDIVSELKALADK